MYAAGKIPGGFIKREGRASEAATLAARLTDRPIRPLFPEGYKDDVQIVITVLSTDHENEPGHPRHDRRVRRADDQRDPVPGPDRRRARRLHRRRVRPQPDVQPARRLPARPRRLGHPRRDHDGRGGRQDPARGRHGRGDHVRPPVARAAHRPPGEAARARRQAEAPAVPRARSPTPCSSSPSWRRRAASSSSSTSRPRAPTRRWPTSSRSPRSGSRAARSPTAGRPSSTRAPDRRQPDARHHRQGRQGRADPRRGRPQGARLRRRRAARRPLGRLRHRVPRGGPRRRHPHRAGHATWTRSSSPARGIRTSRTTSSATLANFFGVELKASHRALPDAEATANLLLWFGNDLPGPHRRARRRASPPRSAPRSSDAAESAKLLEAARRNARVSKSLFGLVQKKTVRKLVLAEGLRMDGRATDEIRPISVEVGLLPRAHGSGLFTRGQTQALTVATLGASSDVQRIDTISPETEKRYLHHYNFPPYSTGENKPMRGPSAGATSATATSPAARCSRSCRARKSSRTSSASCPRSSPATARRRWRRPAAPPSP